MGQGVFGRYWTPKVIGPPKWPQTHEFDNWSKMTFLMTLGNTKSAKRSAFGLLIGHTSFPWRLSFFIDSETFVTRFVFFSR